MASPGSSPLKRPRDHSTSEPSTSARSVLSARPASHALSPGRAAASSTRRTGRDLGAADTLRSRRRLMDSALSSFPYSQKLRAHQSCVNALAFSNGDGRWLASGGDDRVIMLWDMHASDEVPKPAARFRGHRSNIFTISFNASNTHMYSGANDSIVLRYDLSRLDHPVSSSRPTASAPVGAFLDQEGSVHSVATHPHNDNTFLSACEDGMIRHMDSRDVSSLALLTNNASYTDVKWHPRDGNLFVTTDQRGRVTLHDTRTAFSSTPTRRADAIVTSYVTTLSITLGTGIEAITAPESSSVSFTSSGNMFAVEFLLYGPVIYSLGDPVPVVSLTGTALPNGEPIPQGERSYTNKCTTKHGSFGGEENGSLYYATGSDDFRGYSWKIPPLQNLIEVREQILPAQWSASSSASMAFSTSKASEKYLPQRVQMPSYRLEGHQSIVNSVLFHPCQPVIATAGIERFVRLFTHFPTRPGQNSVYPSETRELPARNDPTIVSRSIRGEISTSSDAEDGDSLRTVYSDDDQEDVETIALFDQLLRSGEPNVDFVNNLEGLRWRLVNSDDDSDDDDSGRDSSHDEEGDGDDSGHDYYEDWTMFPHM